MSAARAVAVERATQAVAEAASNLSTLKGVSTMAATGAEQNAGYEALRQ
jgi:hypothetical protein